MKLNSVNIILYDLDKRFLLQHRTSDAERLPDYWAFFGGEIKIGETPLEAVYRETSEELCYPLKSPEFVYGQDFKLDKVEGHMRVYVDFFYGDKTVLKLQEGQAWGWYTAKETEALKMIDHDRVVIRKLVQHLEEKAQIKIT